MRKGFDFFHYGGKHSPEFAAEQSREYQGRWAGEPHFVRQLRSGGVNVEYPVDVKFTQRKFARDSISFAGF